jgi:transposase
MRQDHFDHHLSIRAIARKHRVHRRAVREAIASPVPPPRKPPERSSPKLTGEVKSFIDAVLVSDRTAPRKQRHTARRIWQRVVDELGCTLAESTVRKHVGRRRRELGVGVQAFVPQHHPVGAQGEADFYEADFDFPWGRETASIIVVRSEFSAADHHVAYPAKTQTAFLDGLERGFHHLGGTFDTLRLDNLPQAVAQVLRGSRRREQDRFIAFRSHYGIKTSYTTPGIGGAHEKGGVEGECGRFRRRWLVPVPKVASWEEANEYLLACSVRDLDRTVEGRSMTVGEALALERGFLRPLPRERFELSEVADPRVDAKSRIRVRTNWYSVPVSLVGRVVHVRINPMTIEVSHGGRVVASHPRLHLRNTERLVLDHYLELLAERPGAVPGSLPLHQARARGDFPASYDLLWSTLRARLGDRAGTRAMIEVLLAHRSVAAGAMRLAVERALELGAVDPGTIVLIARGIVAGEAPQPTLIDVGELACYDRPLPDTADYDLLACGCGMAS